jgi:hypothetical protein
MLLLSGCGSKEEVNLRPLLPKISSKNAIDALVKKALPPKYVYLGYKYKDPFVSLTGKGLTLKGNEVPVPNIDSLTLKGIVDDGKEKIAIMLGSGISFILKNGTLYDNRRRPVNGVTGVIKKDSVVMEDSNKKTKEIKLKEESK